MYVYLLLEIFYWAMSEEPSGTSTTNRVITIVQTPLPISSATALDVDASRVVQSGDLSLDGLGGVSIYTMYHCMDF